MESHSIILFQSSYGGRDYARIKADYDAAKVCRDRGEDETFNIV